MSSPRKIFVGSLPDGMDGGLLSAEYSKYGVVEEIFMKPGCEPGRQWAFVTFNNHQEASDAVDLTNGVLMFPGSLRPCEVSLARNQGMFGEGSVTGTTGRAAVSAPPVPVAATGPRKVFVGTLPDGVTESLLRTEFSRFGQVVDIYLKPNCEPGRQWGFITFGTPDEARFAKESCDRVLVLPGASQPCEVTLAKNQGLYGQNNVDSMSQPQNNFTSYSAPQGMGSMDGPSKIFVGSLPTGCNEHMIRAEFSKFGQVSDVFIKPNCEQGRQWAFVTFASQQQAQNAKNATDRVLRFPGSEKTCEVMLAKNQGKFGQQPLNDHPGGQGAGGQVQPYGNGGMGGCYSAPAHQPPPPSTPPPPHVTPWKMYKTESGLPYYHNAQTGATTWDCPPDLQGLPAASPSGGQQGCGGWGQQGCGGGCCDGGGAYGGGGCGGCGGGCQQGCAGGCGGGGSYVNQPQGGCGGGHCGNGCYGNQGGCGGCGGCGARYTPY